MAWRVGKTKAATTIVCRMLKCLAGSVLPKVGKHEGTAANTQTPPTFRDSEPTMLVEET